MGPFSRFLGRQSQHLGLECFHFCFSSVFYSFNFVRRQVKCNSAVSTSVHRADKTFKPEGPRHRMRSRRSLHTFQAAQIAITELDDRSACMKRAAELELVCSQD